MGIENKFVYTCDGCGKKVESASTPVEFSFATLEIECFDVDEGWERVKTANRIVACHDCQFEYKAVPKKQE